MDTKQTVPWRRLPRAAAPTAPWGPSRARFGPFLPEVAPVKSDQEPFLPIDGLISFHSECAAAISLASCKTINGDFPVSAFSILSVFEELKDREKRPCLRIPASSPVLGRALKRPAWSHRDK